MTSSTKIHPVILSDPDQWQFRAAMYQIQLSYTRALNTLAPEGRAVHPWVASLVKYQEGDIFGETSNSYNIAPIPLSLYQEMEILRSQDEILVHVHSTKDTTHWDKAMGLLIAVYSVLERRLWKEKIICAGAISLSIVGLFAVLFVWLNFFREYY
jgi:hypothetical protein